MTRQPASPDTCATCRFMAPDPDSTRGELECRRYAPRPGDDTWGWPPVLPAHWCGEHQPRIVEPPASVPDPADGPDPPA